MRLWYRLRVSKPCGCCGREIAKDVPALELTGPGWRVYRCEGCAGEAVPADIGPQPTTATVVKAKFTDQIASVRGLSRDWKHAQGNDR